MRTTLDLPEDLVKEAMRTTNIKTKTKVITVALEDLVRRSKIGALKKFKGKAAPVYKLAADSDIPVHLPEKRH